jgi:polysaccharide chain length determinant protein (PEP-CTERM system associated)
MWRYRWSALIIAWIASVIGWIMVFALPNQYTASAVIYVDTTSIMKPLLKGLAPETDSDEELNVMSRVLLSRDNLLAVIRDTDMDLEVASPEEREKMVIDLASNIEIIGGGGGKNKWEKKSNIYEIEYYGNSANRVYQVVSNLLNTMIEDTLNTTRTDTVAAQKFLDTQIADYEQRLSVAEQQLAKFKKENVGFMPDEKGSYYSRLQRAQDGVESVRSELRLAEQKYHALNKQLQGENPLLDGDSYQSADITKLRQYQQNLDALLNQFTDQHPDVLALRSAIDELKKNINSGVTSGTGAGSVTGTDAVEFNPVYQQIKVELSKAGVEVETLKIKFSEQEKYVSKLKGSIDVIPEVEAQLARLNRDYDVTRGRYTELAERRESARLAQDAGQNASDVSFRVIEPPVVPLTPSGPNRLLLLVMVLFGSLGAGLAWSFVRYLLQPTFIDTRQITTRFDLPVLGTVGLYLSAEHKQQRRTQLIQFFAATIMLVILFGGAVLYRDI